MNEIKHKKDMVEVGRRLHSKGFVAANDGNISIRLSNEYILITPTGVSKGYMSIDDMLKVDMDGNVISGKLKPTSEMKMHLAVYKNRDDAGAIVHAHPPAATAFAVVRQVFEKVTLPEVIFSLGKISLAQYGTPTTDQVPKSIEKHIGTSDALLLSNHGALTIGTDVYDAYYKMETLEHFCSITVYARQLGGEQSLDEQQTKELLRVRTQVYGKDNPLCIDCGACDMDKDECTIAKGEKATEPEKSTNNIDNVITKLSNYNKPQGSQDEEDIRQTIKKLVEQELKKLT